MKNNFYIERFLFPCPEIEDSAYPDITKKTWNGLERAIFQALKKKNYVIHPYIANTRDGEVYFQIHVSNIHDLDHSLRFIIRKNYRMTEEQEILFFKYCHDEQVIIDKNLYQILEHTILRIFPEIHFIHYKDKRQGLLHLYYTLHASGPRELLYKAGLPHFAARLDEIDSYNYVGRTPSEIFDGIPIKILRALHCNWGFEFLTDRNIRNHLVHFYKSHSKCINDWDLTHEQFQYILACERKEVEFHLKSLRFLSVLDSLYYDDYINYLKHRSAVQHYYKCPLAGYEADMLLHMEVAEELWYALDHREELNQKLQAVYKSSKCLETDIEGLTVLIPHTVEDFLAEGKALMSCIGTYAKLVAEKQTLVAFVHKKKDPKKAYLALELANETLIQAKGKANRALTVEETSWLHTYCKNRCLTYAIPEPDPETLLELDLDEHDIDEMVRLIFEMEEIS